MNYSDTRFTLDVQLHQAQVSVSATLNDTARRLCVGFTDGRKPYVIAEGCTATFAAKKPDGLALFNACTVENNTIIYEFTPQTTNVIGTYECEIRLYNEDGKQLTSPRFLLVVDEQAINDDDVIDSFTEVTMLNQIIANESERIVKEDERIANEDTRNANEDERIANENNRIENESMRESAEQSRADAEVARVLAEENRVSKDQLRDSWEYLRQDSESVRDSAESQRIAAENEREQEEIVRANEEASRDQAEGQRVTNENTRRSNENTRISNEKTRISNESQRLGNDSARETRLRSVETKVSNFDSRMGQAGTEQAIENRVGSLETKTTNLSSRTSTLEGNVQTLDDTVDSLGRDLDERIGDVENFVGYRYNGNILDNVYPIGSIYMSVNSTSPATLFGGSWTQLKNQFLVGAGGTYSVKSGGGTTSHNHNGGSLTALMDGDGNSTNIFHIATRNHYNNDGVYSSWNTARALTVTSGSGGTTTYRYQGLIVDGNTGTTTTLPPYYAVYMWRRDA